MTKLDHNKVTRAKAKRALETDERNTSALSDRELLESAHKEAFRQDYHATLRSLRHGRRTTLRQSNKSNTQETYERQQENMDLWLENQRGMAPPGNKRKP